MRLVAKVCLLLWWPRPIVGFGGYYCVRLADVVHLLLLRHHCVYIIGLDRLLLVAVESLLGLHYIVLHVLLLGTVLKLLHWPSSGRHLRDVLRTLRLPG